jgi:hypothetical protein
VKREPRGATDQRVTSACKWLIYKAIGARELQRTGPWLQSRSKKLQTTGRVKVFQPFQPFMWSAGAAMLEAGYHKRGIEV